MYTYISVQCDSRNLKALKHALDLKLVECPACDVVHCTTFQYAIKCYKNKEILTPSSDFQVSISSLKAQCNSLSPKCISCQFEFTRKERHFVEFQIFFRHSYFT